LLTWSVLLGALAHRSALVRLATAASVGVIAFVVAWTVAYGVLPEGATRFTLGLLPSLDARADSARVATTLFIWNAAFGFGVIALASLYSIGPISLAYFAPWTWLVRFGIALGTNSFALFVPGARIPPLDLRSIISHAGIPELIAYIVLATVLANASLWTQRRITDRNVVRIRHLRDIRLTRLEVSLVGVAFVLLAGAALIETSQIARLQAL
jgi:predicted small integral membrane protein